MSRSLLFVAIAGVVGAGCTASAWAGVQAGGKSGAATAVQARQVIDLTQVKRLPVAQMFDESETYVNYTANSSVAAAAKHYQAALAELGWKQLESGVAATDQYADLLFAKQGYHLRISMGESGGQNESSVMLALLGNVDMRTLPKMSNALAGEHATTVNAGYKTPSAIPDAIKEIAASMVEAGWQPTSGFEESPIDVPHYKSATFRKQACRVMVGVSNDPRNDANPRMVFYIAEPMTPFDFPTWERQSTLQLDSIEQRAATETKWTRKDLVAQLKNWTSEFGWQAENLDDYLAEKAPRLLVADGTQHAIYLAIVESGGQTRLLLERARRTEEAVADAEAPAEEMPADQADMPAQDADFAAPSGDFTPGAEMSDLEKSIQDEVAAELKKALKDLPGNLNAPGQKSVKDLQAQAAEMLSKMNEDDEEEEDEDEDDAEDDSESKSKLEVVPEDASLIDPADAAIKSSGGTLQMGSKKFQLSHALAFVRVEDGSPIRCIVFSDKPLKESELKRRLAAGESVHGHDLTGFDATQVEIRIDGDSIGLNVYCDGLSLGTNTSELKSTLSYVDGMIRGRASLKDFEVRDENLSFELKAAQKVLTGKPIAD